MAEERTLAQLVSDAGKDLSELVRYELALAKAEIRDDVRRGAAAGGLFGAAGYLGLLATIALLIAAGYGLVAAGLDPWLAFLLVAAVLLVIAGLMAVVGVVLIKRIRPPERTLRSTRQTLATVRPGRNGSA